MKPEGVGPSGSADWSPERAGGCPKVTQPVGPTAHLSAPPCLRPRTGGFVFSLSGGMTSSGRALLARDLSGGGGGVGWSQARCQEVLAHGGAQDLWPPLGGSGSCRCNWFSSLSFPPSSLPPSISACFSLLFLSPTPHALLPSLPPFLSPAAFGGTPFFCLPSSSPGPACFLAVCPRR